MVVFRMHEPTRPVFDTIGAFLFAGRWHSRGARVVYAAEHVSLAALETLIHAGGRKIPARSIARIEIPESVSVETVEWIDAPGSQLFGDAWIKENRSAVLRVPSLAVNRMESNFVINPAHPEFKQIHHLDSQDFAFDPRFFPAI